MKLQANNDDTMDTLVIQGGQKLKGEISAKGAKNSSLAILAATVLTPEDIKLHNVPRIGDVLTMIDILASMGAKVSWEGANSLNVSCRDIDPAKLDFILVKRIRASLVLIGSLVARFGEIKISTPGGCNIGSRPIDAHFDALKQFGCEVTAEENFFVIKKVRPHPGRIVLSEFSVTATENLLLAAVGSGGGVEIRIAAGSDYMVQDLCWFLNKMGAHISGIGSPTLRLAKQTALHGLEYTITPDPIEVGTFLCLAAVSNAAITIHGVVPEFLFLELEKFREVGVHFDLNSAGRDPENNYELFDLVVKQSSQLHPLSKLHDMPAPGFIPDLLQPFAVMLTQASGVSIIYDWMYDGRLKYVKELKRMGADMKVLDAHRVMIVGPTPLYGKAITCYDLRAGATMIIAALIAEGTSVISNIGQIERGYERLDERLIQLGAAIQKK